MIAKIRKYLVVMDYKLIFSLMLIQLVPTLYTTLRIFFLGQLPGEYSFSIAGQLTWINLIYEVINESIILPLYYFIGKASNDKREFSNCLKSGFFITFCIYTVLYAYQNVFDATFYGMGKTGYMLFESVVTNCLYYGMAFILYITKIWTPTLNGIVLLFGIGLAFDSLVSFGAYRYLLKKENL